MRARSLFDGSGRGSTSSVLAQRCSRIAVNTVVNDDVSAGAGAGPAGPRPAQLEARDARATTVVKRCILQRYAGDLVLTSVRQSDTISEDGRLSFSMFRVDRARGSTRFAGSAEPRWRAGLPVNHTVAVALLLMAFMTTTRPLSAQDSAYVHHTPTFTIRIRGDTVWYERDHSTQRITQRGDTIILRFTRPDGASWQHSWVGRGRSFKPLDGGDDYTPVGLAELRRMAFTYKAMDSAAAPKRE